MKRILILFLVCMSLVSYAQDSYDDPIYSAPASKMKKGKSKNDVQADSIVRVNDVLYMTIPSKLKINDKIFLVNRSPYTILQAAVVLVNEDGTSTLIGSASLVGPGRSFEMASFDHNWLKNIRGRRIGIKIKGVKEFNFDMLSLGSGNTSIQTEEISGIDPTQITYDFTPSLSEDDHDLYISVTSGTGAFDF